MAEQENIFSCFEQPKEYPSKWDFYYEGGSPKLLEFLKEYINERLEKISKISICLYLFNNPELHNFFQKISALGIIVNIISIPLEGYDSTKPKQIIYKSTRKPAYEVKKSKYDLAKPIYQDLASRFGDGYNLYIFPHMYKRSSSSNKFARGGLPYSLHAKYIFIEFNEKDSAIGLISSNLATRDLVKEENLIIIEGNKSYGNASKKFFSDLISQSIPVNKFQWSDDWRRYKIRTVQQPKNSGNFFIAPFYKDSPFIAEKAIIEEIQKAKDMIFVCGQHIAAYHYKFPTIFPNEGTKGFEKREGFLGDVLRKASNGINVACLSQTFVAPNGSNKFQNNKGYDVETRVPANTSKFKSFVAEYFNQKNTFYMVNQDIHSKYIIVDDTLIVTTCNFTPTQFIYIDDVILPDLGYRGVFSEVGQFIKIRKSDIVERYKEHFRSYWKRGDTIKF